MLPIGLPHYAYYRHIANGWGAHVGNGVCILVLYSSHHELNESVTLYANLALNCVGQGMF